MYFNSIFIDTKQKVMEKISNMVKVFLLKILEYGAIDVTHITGQRASYSGIYRNGTQFIPLSKYEIFPPCKGCNSSTWVLVVQL